MNNVKFQQRKTLLESSYIYLLTLYTCTKVLCVVAHFVIIFLEMYM